MESRQLRLLRLYHLLFILGSSLLYFSCGQGVLQFQEGDKIVVDCRSSESIGKNVSYKWTKNNVTVVSNGRIQVDSIGGIIIMNSTLADQGIFICHQNGIEKMRVTVQITSKIKDKIPKDIVKTYFIKIRLVNNDKHDAVIRYDLNGETKEFEVQSDGHKTEIISMKSSSQPSAIVFRAYDRISNTALQVNDKVAFAVIPSLERKEVTMHIPNAYLWFVNQIPGNVQLIRKQVGESAILDCYAKGFPPPKVQWYKRNKTVAEVSYRFVQSRDTSSLWSFKMVNLVLADSGDYHCVVKNRLATMKRHFHLVVQELKAVSKPLISIMSPRNETVQVGTEVVFKCDTPLTDIMPYIRWEKRVTYVTMKNISDTNSTEKIDPILRIRMNYIEEKIKSGNVTVRKRTNDNELTEHLKTERTFKSRLIISRVDFTDEAEYACIVFNTMGYSTISGYLYVRPVPPPSLEELAKRYASRFGESAPYSDLPLSVIIALPVGLIVLLVIGFIWWNEQHQRRKDADRLSLIPLSTMRNDDLFDSEEHLPSHYPKNHQKRLSHIRTNTSEEGDQSSSRHEDEPEETSLGKILTNPLISTPAKNQKSKSSIKDEEKPECDQRMAALLLSDSNVCSPEPDSINCSEMELEWEPQDLDLDLGRVH